MDTQEPESSLHINMQYGGSQANNNPEGFYELLDAIRAVPPLYLGKTSLRELDMFLHGYFTCKRMLKADLSEEEQEFRGFDEFVQKKYRWRDSGGWAAKIQYHHRTEDGAFHEFFKLLDGFRASKRKQRKRSPGQKSVSNTGKPDEVA